MFSSRIEWELRPNRISELLAHKRSTGCHILDLTQSNPTVAGIVYPEDRILSAIADRGSLIYDPDSRGMQSGREAVARYYEARGHSVNSEHILLTSSTSEAYSWLFKLLTDPGDEVLVPRPSYPLFDFLATLENVRAVQYPLYYDGRWALDIHSLEAAITDRTRAVALVNPNNPTGAFLKRAELEQLVSLCARKGLAIISDEVFADYPLTQDADRVTTLADVNQVLTFCLSGLSKVAGLPQLKLGWVSVNGPEPLFSEALTRLELIADTYLSVGTPVQLALPALLAEADNIQKQIRTRTQKNLGEVRRLLPPHSPARLLNVEGGWQATIEVPKIRTEEEWTIELLERYNVLVQPGYFYDFDSEAFLILSLLTDPGEFEQGVRRLMELIHQ
jgi:alanine-synthesizing transaminase